MVTPGSANQAWARRWTVTAVNAVSVVVHLGVGDPGMSPRGGGPQSMTVWTNAVTIFRRAAGAGSTTAAAPADGVHLAGV